MMHRLSAASMFLYLIFFLGCGGQNSNSPTIGSSGSGTTGGRLYVSNLNAILRFDNVTNVSGNVASNAAITGASTQLSTPQFLLLDEATNRLFVANQGAGSILIFQNASTRTGNTPPDTVLTSGSLAQPVDVAIDS